MKKIVLCLLVCTVVLPDLLAQKTEGVVTYDRIYHWSKIYARLDYLSQEEKDRIQLTWGNDDDNKTTMKLFFTPTHSKYTYDDVQKTSDDGRYSYRQRDFIIFRDFEKNTKTEIIEMLGKTYVIQDSLQTPNWKVMNKIKEINGHLCMLAVTEDTIKKQKIEAWFAHNLPISAGPEQYFGLPGIIMELDINEGDVVVTATNVEFKPIGEEVELPRKLRGRKIDTPAYDQMLWEHIRDSMISQRNPFWSIPY